MRVLIAVALLMCGTAGAQQSPSAPETGVAEMWQEPDGTLGVMRTISKCVEVIWTKTGETKMVCPEQAEKQVRSLKIDCSKPPAIWEPSVCEDDLSQPKQEKAQPVMTQSSGVLTTVPQTRNFILIGRDAKMLVTIHPDGTIEYGKDYTPDTAAKVFWEAIGTNMPCKELSKR